MLNTALRYAELGLAVIPLNGKIPIFDNWPTVSTNDPIQIRTWWTGNPRANIGIVTGAKSHIFVVDIDPRHGGQDSLESLWQKHGRFPATWTGITGSGGSHYYFRYPSFAVANKTAILPGIDIRGDNGQVVAPPSIHPITQQPYMWDGLMEPWDDREGLAEAPAWLLELLQPAKKPAFSAPSSIPNGTRHTTMVSIAGVLRRMGFNSNEILPLLIEVNNNRCEEPAPAREILTIAKSFDKYAPDSRNVYEAAGKLWRMLRHYERQREQDRSILQPVNATAFYHKEFKPVKELIDRMLYNGCTILAGPPKSGKSYLTLCMSLALASGQRFLKAKPVFAQGRVAYFALEESQNRTAFRIQQLWPEEDEAMKNIDFFYSVPSMKKGGLKIFREYLDSARPTLVIIDTLMAFVTGDSNSRTDIFRDDYKEIKAFQELAIEFNTAIVVVHHTSKVGGLGVQAVAGTHGLTAAADSIWTFQRQPGRRAVLEITGREVEDQAFLLELDLRNPVGWFMVDQGEDVVVAGERQVILEVLSTGPKSLKQLSAEIGRTIMNSKRILDRMVETGEVVKDLSNTYRVAVKRPDYLDD